MSKPELRMDRLATTAALGAFVGLATLSTGCISDTDCGICDPDNLVLETLSGKNYADKKIQLLTDGVDQGKYYIEDIGACVETEW